MRTPAIGIGLLVFGEVVLKIAPSPVQIQHILSEQAAIRDRSWKDFIHPLPYTLADGEPSTIAGSHSPQNDHPRPQPLIVQVGGSHIEEGKRLIERQVRHHRGRRQGEMSLHAGDLEQMRASVSGDKEQVALFQEAHTHRGAETGARDACQAARPQVKSQ